MDVNGKKPRGGKKNAARPAPATDATGQPAALGKNPALSDAAAGAQQVDDDGQPVAAPVDDSRRAGGGAEEKGNRHDDDDDERVEMFYALLANIRARRGLPPHPHSVAVASSSSLCTAGGGDTDAAAGDSSTRNKRLRLSSSEPPWRPAFRMEDFEDPAPTAAASCKMTTKRTRGAGHDDHGHGESGGSPRPPDTAAAASSSVPPEAVGLQRQSDGRSSRD